MIMAHLNSLRDLTNSIQNDTSQTLDTLIKYTTSKTYNLEDISLKLTKMQLVHTVKLWTLEVLLEIDFTTTICSLATTPQQQAKFFSQAIQVKKQIKQLGDDLVIEILSGDAHESNITDFHANLLEIVDEWIHFLPTIT